MRKFVIVVLAVAVCGGGRGELAGGAKPVPTTEDSTQAKEHYKKGTKLYDLGKYDEAIKEFEAAYEVKDEPVLLYNIAQAYRLDNKYAEALRFYRNYLRKYVSKNKKDPPNKTEVEAKIADMENLIAQQNRVATAPPADTLTPGQRPPTSGPSSPVTTPPPPQTTTTNTPATNQPAQTEENTEVASNEHPATTTRPG